MYHPLQSEPLVSILYPAPSVVQGDTQYALPLMVLSEYLGGGTTSVLYQELVVKRKLATEIGTNYGGFTLGPDVFEISATPADGVSPEKLEKAIHSVMDATLARPLDADDIERAKTGLKAATLYAREGLQGMAYMVGAGKMIGLPTDYINQWPTLIDQVKESEMLDAARSVIVDKGSVTGYLLPEPQGRKP